MLEPFEYILKKDIAGLTIYLEYGNVNVQNEKGCSLLCYAIKLHDNDAFKLLIKNYVDLNLADENGNTCFHYAVIYNRLGYLKMLLKQGGNPLKKNKKGQTPMYLACFYGRETILNLYLEKYSLHLEEMDEQQETIAIAMIRSKNMNFLRKYPIDAYLEMPNYIGNTPLLVAVEIQAFEVASYLLAKHAFIHHRNHLGETALFIAVKNSDRRMILLLLQHGACPVVQNRFAESIDFYYLKPEIKELMEEEQSKDYIRLYSKKFPLHYAILTENKEAFQRVLMIRYLNLVDDYGYTPLVLAKKLNLGQMVEEIELLLKKAYHLKFKNNK